MSDDAQQDDVKAALRDALRRETQARADADSARVESERRARHATGSADIAMAFAQGGPLHHTLQCCCEAAVTHMSAVFARIWTVDAAGTTLELRASAGLYTHLDGAHARVPIGKFKIGLVAAERMPHISNDISNDPRIGDPAWASRQKLVAFAGYPLLAEGQLVGVVALFAREPFADDTLLKLASLAQVISIGIDRKRTEALSEESRERYRFLADLVPAQVWTATPDGALDYVNQRALEYFAVQADQLLGTAWLKLVHAEDVPIAVERWTRSLNSGEPYEQEFRLRRGPDGSYRWFLARATAHRNAHGGIDKWFGTNTEIEDHKRNERERDRLIQALARSNADLDRVAYVASHDLKAPLRGISSLAEWVEADAAGKLDAKSVEHLRLMRVRIDRMNALIEGVLDYARADRQNHKVEEIATDVLVREVIGLLSPPSYVTVTVAPNMPRLVSERVPLQRVVMNLIGNAVKYGCGDGSKPKEIHVGWADAGDAIDFSVVDAGDGIAPEFQAQVWEMFRTLAARDRVESTGIGLAIVQKLVKSRGGRVWIESELGKGASFHFTWPKCQRG